MLPTRRRASKAGATRSLSGFKRRGALSQQPIADPQVPLARLRLFAVIVLLGVAALIGRLWFLQVYNGETYRAQAEDNRLRPIREVAPRGIILDSKGRVLVTNSAQFTVFILPSDLPHERDKVKDAAAKAEVYHQLAKALEIGDDDLTALIKRRDPGGGNPIPIAEGVSDHVMARIAENSISLRGVRTDVEPVRVYPGGKLASHVLGTIGPIDQKDMADDAVQARGYQPGDFIGKTGVEREYDQYLCGEAGGAWYEVDARGRQRREIREDAVVQGATLTLALDQGLQKEAEDALGGRKGAAVAIDPRDGRVLAYVSSPAFDPSVFAHRPLLHATFQGIVDSGSQNDRAGALAQPPGSTFKIISSAAALASGTVDANTTYFCSGGIRMGNYYKHCDGVHGSLDLTHAIEASCDVYFYRAGLAMGPNTISDWARNFGLGQATGIDLPTETKGIVPSPAWKKAYAARHAGRDGTWHPGDTANMAIGQGDVKASPLQMALVAGAIANGGTVYAPRVVLKAVSTKDGQEVYTMQPTVTHTLNLKPEQIALIRQGMRQVVAGSRGTAQRAALLGLTIAGKTGSAETRTGGPMHAWFMCYAPFEAPTIAICVFLDADGKKQHGGVEAAPIARKMLAEYFHLPDRGGYVSGMRVD